MQRSCAAVRGTRATAQQLTKNVFVETGFTGCNVAFVVTSQGVVMIDTPMMPTQARRWAETMAAYGPLRYLLHTEFHLDHIRGAAFFPEAIIVAQELVRAQATKDSRDPQVLAEYREAVAALDPEALPLLEGYRQRVPDVTFQRRATVTLGDHVFDLYLLPGHTAGQIAVCIAQEGVLFTGDNVVSATHPYLTDATPRRWLRSLEILRRFKPTWLVPGHGPVGGVELIEEMKRYLEDALRAVGEAMERGLTREQVLQEVSLLDRYPVPPGERDEVLEYHRAGIAHLYDRLLSEGHPGRP